MRRLLNLSKTWYFLGLIMWVVPLLLFNHGQDSLIAHDETTYAVRSRWMLESGDWLTPQSWSELAYEKTPGFYWILASIYTIFGISEVTSRIPSQIASVFSIFLVYEITGMLLNKRIAWLSSAILSVSFLWLQVSRLVAPDIITICIALFGIFCLLQSELYSKYRYYWGFSTGLSVGLGFLIKGQLIFVPFIGLLPYLIWQNRRHRHLNNPMLYVGFVIGFLPVMIWFWISWQHYGSIVFEQFFSLVTRISTEQRNGHSPFYYLWNLPIKVFPWPLFSILGLLLVYRRPSTDNAWILVVCPLIIFLEISITSTRLPHYSLMLCPWMAILAGIALDWLGENYNRHFQKTKYFFLPRNLSYVFGSLGAVVFLAGIILKTGILQISVSDGADIKSYSSIGLVLGLGWLSLPAIWLARHRFGHKFLTANYWLASLLVPAWLAMAVAGSNGLLTNYSPDVKLFVKKSEIADVLKNQSINFVVQKTETMTTGGDKALLLLTFETPSWGKRFKKLTDVPINNYAWVSPESEIGFLTNERQIGTFRDWKLIQVIERK
ncbi:MAG: glycosyltransferase family 39 protein [Nostocales cyanobacterium LE14-WE4]|uniref:ArnT family glycosyltransferase n=1 Tax=Dolichospermum circinale TaxID=109265 RepID=UPI001A360B61|nr:glycosyltransferase family 39 protein [Dolichospermum circinale]MBJ7297631.1 glycosyltransferase family 39 protein [Dolichospermum sp.]MDB9450477.1 glycosyltransferase family 39 protein [Dolichospermum circinale CS-547]MDJ0500149.1 glycosyltransferase family 39 protein [Nostocales cyanobacterium LE14-WE4]